MADIEIEGIKKDLIKVKQRIGLFGGIAIVVGSIIGSGIFISPRGALLYSGSVGLSLVVWIVVGVLATILALVYAQLGVLLPRSGGDYTCIRLMIGEFPAFLVTWTQTTVTQPAGKTVLALVFADYLCAPIFGGCGPPNGVRKTIAAVELLALAITNFISVRFATSVQGLLTFLKTLTLVVIAIGGLVFLIRGKTDTFAGNLFEGSTNDVSSMSLAIYQCMWAYSGYSVLTDVSEEIIRPHKNIPRVIIISMLIVTVVYIFTNISYFTVLTKTEFLSVPAVAFSWGTYVLGPAAIIIPISVMCSVHGAANGSVFADGRVRFAAARAGHLPEVLSFLHHRTGIPTVALMFNTLCSLVLLLPGEISELINMVSFVYSFMNTFTVIALLKLKYIRRNVKEKDDVFTVPLIVPVLALMINLFLITSPFVSNPKIEFLYGVAYLASGVVIYFPFVHWKCKFPGFDHLTTVVQLMMETCPTVQEEDLVVVKETQEK